MVHLCNGVLYRVKKLVQIYEIKYLFNIRHSCRSQWPSGLRREIVGSNPTGGSGCLSVVSVEFCQVEVSATSWSLV